MRFNMNIYKLLAIVAILAGTYPLLSINKVCAAGGCLVFEASENSLFPCRGKILGVSCVSGNPYSDTAQDTLVCSLGTEKADWVLSYGHVISSVVPMNEQPRNWCRNSSTENPVILSSDWTSLNSRKDSYQTRFLKGVIGKNCHRQKTDQSDGWVCDSYETLPTTSYVLRNIKRIPQGFDAVNFPLDFFSNEMQGKGIYTCGG